MKYSKKLAQNYSANRSEYNDTDPILFAELESVGLVGKRIIDIGCGDGSHAAWLAERGASQVIGADLNESMIVLAKEKTRIWDNLSFLLADGSKLPIASESMDRVVSNYVIHYFPRAVHIFNEISRLLKDDGYFIGTFNITDVEKGFEYLYNQDMPIRLQHRHGSVLIKNLIKPREEIEQAIADSALIVLKELEINNLHSVVDESYPYKQYIRKQSVLMVLQRVKRSV